MITRTRTLLGAVVIALGSLVGVPDSAHAVASSLTGTVTYPHGVSVFARVDLLASGTTSVVATGTTDLAGRYLLSVDAGTYDLRVTPFEPSLVELIKPDVVVGDPLTTRDVVLGYGVPTIRISGSIALSVPPAFAVTPSERLARTFVSVYRLDDAGVLTGSIPALVAEDGSYFADVPVGRLRVQVSVGVRETNFSFQTTPRTYDANSVIPAVLFEGVARTISVRSSSLTPRAGVFVQAGSFPATTLPPPDTVLFGASGRTEPDGNVTVLALSVSSARVFVSTSPGAPPVTSVTADFTNDVPVVVTLADLIPVRGRVVLTGPAATLLQQPGWPSYRVALTRSSSDPFPQDFVATTTPDGSFSVDVPAGQYRIDASAAIVGPVGTLDSYSVRSDLVDVTSALAVPDIALTTVEREVTVQTGGAAASNKFVSATNRTFDIPAASGAQTFSANAMTGADGRARVIALAVPNVRVNVAAIPFGPPLASTTADFSNDSPVVISYEGKVTIRGRFLANETLIIPTATRSVIAMRLSSTGETLEQFPAGVGPDGLFAVDVPPGRYDVIASVRTSAFDTSITARRSLGDLTSDAPPLDITLTPVRRAITVLNADGSPVPFRTVRGAAVPAGVAGDSFDSTVRTDGFGNASLVVLGNPGIAFVGRDETNSILIGEAHDFARPEPIIAVLGVDDGLRILSSTASTDGDNVIDTIEIGAPDRDRNDDGLLDAVQGNVASLPRTGIQGEPYVAMAVDTALTLSDVSTLTIGSVNNPPFPEAVFPQGLLKFATEVAPGSELTARVYAQNIAGITGFGTYNPGTRLWKQLPPESVVVNTVDNSVSIRVLDNGVGDNDLTPGRIAVFGGPMFGRLAPPDVVPPEVVGTPDRAPNANGWYNGPVTIRWTATDASGTATQPPDTVVSSEGEFQQIVSPQSCDVAGNCAIGSVTLSLDRTPPSVSGRMDPLPNERGWFNGPVTVRWVSADALSTSTQPPPVAVTSEGRSQPVTSAESCDPAGNCAIGRVSVSIDRTPPVVTGVFDRQPNANGWFNETVRISWTVTDASGTGVSPPDSFVFADGRDQRVESLQTCDAAGNCASGSVVVNFDRTAPVVVGSADRPASSSNWHNAPFVVRWSASDALSDVAAPPPTPASGEGRGLGVVSDPVCDLAGNCRSGAFEYNIDLTAPTVIVDAPESVALDSGLVISCRATDLLSGIFEPFRCENQVIDSLTMTPGANVFTYTVSDRAGNVTSASRTVRLDVTVASVSELVDRYVTDANLARRLKERLQRGQIRQFVNDVDNNCCRRGRPISSAQAEVLKRYAQLL